VYIPSFGICHTADILGAVSSNASPTQLTPPSQNDDGRTIWIFWSQGFENAPEVVHICLRSWKLRNPGWRVVELSDSNLAEYVDPEPLANLRALSNIRTQKFANLLRIYLVGRHGGVWADATCFCCKPLDDWLPEYMVSGFFAFRRRPHAWLEGAGNLGWRCYTERSGDRIVANWFVSALRGNPLALIFFEKHLALFAENSFSLQGSARGAKRVASIERVLNRNPKLSQLWTHPAVMKTARVYPYFIFHYHFAKVVSEDETCRDIWNRTPVFLGDSFSRLKRFMVSPVTDSLLRYLNNPDTPMHKLTWKYRHEEFTDGCVLDYLTKSLG
jgi:hypothetical protein